MRWVEGLGSLSFKPGSLSFYKIINSFLKSFPYLLTQDPPRTLENDGERLR